VGILINVSKYMVDKLDTRKANLPAKHNVIKAFIKTKIPSFKFAPHVKGSDPK